MRVFVAGGTGVIGRELIPGLLEAGHEVTAMTRKPERSERLRSTGATPVICDALDPAAVREAVAAGRPQAIVHHLTDLSRPIEPRRIRLALAANSRLRREGTRNLVEAATAAGVGRIVVQSICFLVYPPGPGAADESVSLHVVPRSPYADTVAAVGEMERLATGTAGLDGVVLRFGHMYGPGTAYAPGGPIGHQVRASRYPVIGKGEGVFSFVHVDDVCAATIAGLEAPPGTYNVCDDEPAPMREWLPAYADALDAPPPRRLPSLLARLATRGASRSSETSRGASNAKARRELGWAPRWESWRRGFREALG